MCKELSHFSMSFVAEIFFLSKETNMRKAVVILTALICTGGAAVAGDGEITGSFELIYLSKYVSKGRSEWGQQGGIYKAINLNLWDTGFGTYVINRHSTAANSNRERYDYGVYYRNKLFEDTPFVTNYKLRWAYEHYPNIARNKFKTTNEWAFTFSWPKLFDSGLVPKYIAYYEYPAGSGYANHDVTGWVHQFGLGYDMAVPGLFSDTSEHIVKLSASLSYRDGLGGKSKDSDWSHATFGASTKIDIAEDISLITGLYYQLSMEDDVSTRDHLYTTLGMRYQF